MGFGQVCVEFGAVSDRAGVDRRALICGVHEQGFMEISRRRSIINLSSFHCFVRQLTASILNREWGWADLFGVLGLFLIVQTSIDGR